MIQINEAEYFGIKPIAPDWMKKRPQAFCESNNVGCGLTQTTYNTGIMGKRGKKIRLGNHNAINRKIIDRRFA